MKAELYGEGKILWKTKQQLQWIWSNITYSAEFHISIFR